jgi:L-threonylcarbamoyladenylate synthase
LLDRFVTLLKNGEVVAFPTETVYGLGADAWNPDAVQTVFTTKGRPADNPLIVHISQYSEAEDFATEISDDARKLMKAYWPGPLTLIFKKKPDVLDLITAGLDTVALRWPKHPLSQDLIARVGPLVAPSANSSGKPSPTRPEHVKEDFGEDFPVIEGGETDIGLESTVLDVTSTPYQIYRPGAISAHDITKITRKAVVQADKESGNTAAKSPGTKYSHYTPQATVNWLDIEQSTYNSDTLYLLHKRSSDKSGDNVITYDTHYKQMARELYDRFRQADHRHLRQIHIEPFSDADLEQPIVAALHNRITKAIG